MPTDQPPSGESPGRRAFLRQAGVAALAAAGCHKLAAEDPYRLEKPPVPGTAGWRTGEERWVKTACGQCQAGCGVRVRVVEGRAVKIEGNRDFPLNRGGIGPKAQASTQLLYHPDRLHGPLRRSGPRGSGGFEPVTWDLAVAEIAAALAELRARGQPERLVVIDGQPRGSMHELWARFLTAFGSPNHIGHQSASYGAQVLAVRYMQGGGDLPAYDWERTCCVVGLGTNLLDSWCQTMHLMRAAQSRRGTPGRAKLVHIASRFSATSSRADERISIEPGTYGALALGLAHVLVRERLYDRAFVAEHTFGFEPWTDGQGRKHLGFRELLERDYQPARIESVTGVPVATVERIARELWELRPSVVIADGGATAASNGLGTAMAVHALNALLGNLERPGGALVQRRAPLGDFPAFDLDATARRGLGAPRLDGAGGKRRPLATEVIQAVPQAILAGDPYPAQALFLYYSNPVFSKPEPRLWRQALARVPLVVSFSPFADESAQMADFILPDHSFLERWDVVEAPGAGYPLLALREPAVAPLYDTRHSGDVLLAIAGKLPGPVASALPWPSYRAAIEPRLAALAGQETTSAQKPPEDAAAVLEAMRASGGWWNAKPVFERWEAAFQTPSRKLELYSQAIAARLGAAGVAAPDELCLPHYRPPRFEGSEQEYPLILLPFRAVNYAEGGVRHLPWLVELPLAAGNPWHPAVELNPADGARFGVRDGDDVDVESPAGRARFRVRLYPGVHPGTLALPLGHGAWPAVPGRDSSAMVLLANHSDPLAGTLALQGTRVRVSRARAG